MSGFWGGVIVGIAVVALAALLWWMGRPKWHPGCYTRDAHKER